jgi:hypothetical protein
MKRNGIRKTGRELLLKHWTGLLKLEWWYNVTNVFSSHAVYLA